MTAKWNKTYKEKHPDRVRASHRKYDSTKKDKSKANVRAKTNWHNEKTNKCGLCKKIGKTQFHHISYLPNIFIELCIPCHKKQHEEDLR